MKLLIIEDEPELRDLVERALEKEGYEVAAAASKRDALTELTKSEYDCVLLDIMLPDGSGLDILRRMKKDRRHESVIILSARDSVDDKVEGLELGADDYLPKPFHLNELSARIRSVARRRRGGAMQICCGNVSIDPASKTATVDGATLQLLKKEYAILEYFINRKGYVIDKEQLASAVWGDAAENAYSYDFIYAQVKNLRRKLSDAGATAKISAVYGFGYKMEETL